MHRYSSAPLFFGLVYFISLRAGGGGKVGWEQKELSRGSGLTTVRKEARGWTGVLQVMWEGSSRTESAGQTPHPKRSVLSRLPRGCCCPATTNYRESPTTWFQRQTQDAGSRVGGAALPRQRESNTVAFLLPFRPNSSAGVWREPRILLRRGTGPT